MATPSGVWRDNLRLPRGPFEAIIAGRRVVCTRRIDFPLPAEVVQHIVKEGNWALLGRPDPKLHAVIDNLTGNQVIDPHRCKGGPFLECSYDGQDYDVCAPCLAWVQHAVLRETYQACVMPHVSPSSGNPSSAEPTSGRVVACPMPREIRGGTRRSLSTHPKNVIGKSASGASFLTFKQLVQAGQTLYGNSHAQPSVLMDLHGAAAAAAVATVRHCREGVPAAATPAAPEHAGPLGLCPPQSEAAAALKSPNPPPSRALRHDGAASGANLQPLDLNVCGSLRSCGFPDGARAVAGTEASKSPRKLPGGELLAASPGTRPESSHGHSISRMMRPDTAWRSDQRVCELDDVAAAAEDEGGRGVGGDLGQELSGSDGGGGSNGDLGRHLSGLCFSCSDLSAQLPGLTHDDGSDSDLGRELTGWNLNIRSSSDGSSCLGGGSAPSGLAVSGGAMNDDVWGKGDRDNSHAQGRLSRSTDLSASRSPGVEGSSRAPDGRAPDGRAPDGRAPDGVMRARASCSLSQATGGHIGGNQPAATSPSLRSRVTDTVSLMDRLHTDPDDSAAIGTAPMDSQAASRSNPADPDGGPNDSIAAEDRRSERPRGLNSKPCVLGASVGLAAGAVHLEDAGGACAGCHCAASRPRVSSQSGVEMKASSGCGGTSVSNAPTAPNRHGVARAAAVKLALGGLPPWFKWAPAGPPPASGDASASAAAREAGSGSVGSDAAAGGDTRSSAGAPPSSTFSSGVCDQTMSYLRYLCGDKAYMYGTALEVLRGAPSLEAARGVFQAFRLQLAQVPCAAEMVREAFAAGGTLSCNALLRDAFAAIDALHRNHVRLAVMSDTCDRGIAQLRRALTRLAPNEAAEADDEALLCAWVVEPVSEEAAVRLILQHRALVHAAGCSWVLLCAKTLGATCGGDTPRTLGLARVLRSSGVFKGF